MLWTAPQKDKIDTFISLLKAIHWFEGVGKPSDTYWVVDTIWEACDTHGQQPQEVWGLHTEALEKKALKQLF